MMEFLFQILLLPLLPELADRGQEVERRVQAVAQQLAMLDQGKLGGQVHPASFVALRAGEPVLNEPHAPKMTGRILTETLEPPVSTDAAPGGAEFTAATFSLNGILRVGGARVAIVSQGDKEFVLAQGSYLSGAYQVKSIDAQSIQLISLKDRAQDLKLVLNTKPAE